MKLCGAFSLEGIKNGELIPLNCPTCEVIARMEKEKEKGLFTPFPFERWLDLIWCPPLR